MKNIGIVFDNSYHRDMVGFYVDWQGEPAAAPEAIEINYRLGEELGIDLSSLDEQTLAAIFSGSTPLPGAAPIAQVYAGHQFGHFNPQLGDGRALLLGETLDTHGTRRDIQLKGSGKTPFSRNGDGKSALGPVLREYLVSEAMYRLGVPTTRALAAVTTGERVRRESSLPGGILTRIASSHLRVGTFEFFAAQGKTDQVRQLADYAIARHYPFVKDQSTPYLGLLEAVCEAQAKLIAKWMLLGFIHGVMNTDNCTISGETIDYGPCAFMDRYNPQTVFSSIDAQGRYAYTNQPSIGVWNLSRLADTLLPLIDDNEDQAVEKATFVLQKFSGRYFTHWLDGMRKKLGLINPQDEDMQLATDFLSSLEGQNADFTQVFRSLSEALDDPNAIKSLLKDADALDPWLDRWKSRIGMNGEENSADIKAAAALMNANNPIYIPRNHKVEEALDAATYHNNFDLFRKLVEITSSPYQRQEGCDDYATPAPMDLAPYRTFCGT